MEKEWRKKEITLADNPWRSVTEEAMPTSESFIIHEKFKPKFVFCKCNVIERYRKVRYIIDKPHEKTETLTREEVVRKYDFWMPYFSLPSELSNEDRSVNGEIFATIFIRRRQFIDISERQQDQVYVSASRSNQKHFVNKKTGDLKQIRRITFKCRDCQTDDGEPSSVAFAVKSVELMTSDGAAAFKLVLGKKIF